MGDLRNKAKHLADQAAQWRRMADLAHRDRAQADGQPRCLCGFTAAEVIALWSFPGPDRWAPMRFYCPACLPAEFFGLVALAAANLPDDA